MLMGIVFQALFIHMTLAKTWIGKRTRIIKKRDLHCIHLNLGLNLT